VVDLEVSTNVDIKWNSLRIALNKAPQCTTFLSRHRKWWK
jgi:hypothetical protein